MDAQKISVKIFADSASADRELFVPIFHRWIQEQALPEHLLIDVADYEHVHAGPGTVLVASEANIHMDKGENRLGLMYFRKAPLPGSFADRLAVVLRQTLKAAAKLASEPELAGKISFRTDEIQIKINDRLLAPNTDQTFAAVKADVSALAGKIFTDKQWAVSSIVPNTSYPLIIRVQASNSPGLDAMLRRLG